MSQTTNLNGLTFDSIPRMSIFKNDDVIKFICDKEENTSIMIGKISKIDLDTNKLTFRYAWNINDKG
ncbi:MAG: hypothetical protein RSC92_05690, partial [Clostridia bacterium]